MPRRADIPCAGACGRLIWRGTGALAPGESMCRKCRKSGHFRMSLEACRERDRLRNAARMKRPCVGECGRVVWGDRCRPCSLGLACTPGRCPSCSGDPGQAGGPCPACVLATRRARYARKSAKRRGALTGHRLTIADLGRRDGWSCHLCGDDIEAELPAAHRWGATLDHVVALAAGGLDVASNLRLAHRSCNSARGSRSVQDYLLAA